MNELQFNVVVTGQLVAGASREQAIAALCARFGLDAAKAEALLAGKPSIVKRGVDAAIAQKLCAVLQQIGVVGVAQPASSGVAESRPAAPPPVPPPAAPVSPPRGLSFAIEGQPDFAFLTVQLPAGETLKVEASAMATMDTNLRMKTKLGGGLSRLVTGESIFINEFTAEGGAGEIGIAPGAPGDLRHVHLDGDTLYLQNSGYVASTTGVAVEAKWQGLTKGFFSGESLFLVRCQGSGDLWFSSYGGIIEIDVDGDYVVDTGNIVAFTGGLEYRITKVGGYKSLFFSGEGLVCRFSGRGKVWIQTRKVAAFVAWAWPFRPVRKAG